MERISRLCYVLIIFPVICLSQAVINVDGQDCGLHGTATINSKTYNLNELKNRYQFPKKIDFDTATSFGDIMGSSDPNAFSQEKAIKLSGYIFSVKTGGVESCNCKSKNPEFRDTHLELTPDENHTGPESRIIVEVTPRMREIVALKGIDWSTYSLKKFLKGKKVEIEGWLFYDAEHENAAFANDREDQLGAVNWRATCWEIHPVTGIKILEDSIVINKEIKKVNSSQTSQATSEKNTTSTTSSVPKNNSLEKQGNDSFKYILALLTIIAIVIVLIILLRRKR